MVTTVNNLKGIPPVFSPLSGSAAASSTTAASAAENGTHFDQVELSPEPSGTSRFQKELTARLVQEVRTANTTGDVQKIRDEIHARSYQADPSGIAARLLLERVSTDE